jgi:hypothetical protein
MRHGNRWGKFRIAGHVLAETVAHASKGDWAEVGSLTRFMSECFIVRAGDSPSDDTIEYLAVSPHFDEIEEGEEIPEYEIWFERERTCNACGGTEWGPAPSMDPVPAEIACQGCGNSVERSHWVTRVKRVKRVQRRVMYLSGDIPDADIATFKREWELLLAKKGWMP